MFNFSRLDSFNLQDAVNRLIACRNDRELCQRYQFEVRELCDYIERLTISFKNLRESRGYNREKD